MEIIGGTIRKQNKRHKDWKGKSENHVFTNDMIVYLAKFKESTEQLLEVTEFISVVQNKVKKQRTFIYILTTI